jgi:hypothetical protein
MYATETYFYISTYMALHPGYAEITDFRLPHIQNTTWTMLETNGDLNTPIIAWTFNQYSDALKFNSSRIMSYEKAISYLILDRVISRDYKTAKIFTNYQEWPISEDIELEEIPPLFPWLNILTSLIPAVLLGSTLSFRSRIKLLRKIQMFFRHS